MIITEVEPCSWGKAGKASGRKGEHLREGELTYCCL